MKFIKFHKVFYYKNIQKLSIVATLSFSPASFPLNSEQHDVLLRYPDRKFVMHITPGGNNVVLTGKIAWGQAEAMAPIDIENSQGHFKPVLKNWATLSVSVPQETTKTPI